MDEFSLIKKYFAPLAGKVGLNLTDDAALIDVPKGQTLVVTADAMNEGVHFLGTEPAHLIAQKLLRVNLSDLAAMGAKPYVYFLTLALPKTTSEEWIADFARGLRQDQKQFSIALAGGDTTATNGALSLSLTALGFVPKGKALKRSGAKPGDAIYVSGTLGDSALGLRLLIPPPIGGRLGGGQTRSAEQVSPHPNPPPMGEGDYLIDRYFLPQPRLKLGKKLRGLANACIDISDGLVQDLGHVCAASHVSAEIHSSLLPLSQAAKKCEGALQAALSGGDDYELLFTVPPRKEKSLASLSRTLKLKLTKIGTIGKGKSVKVLDENGNEMAIEHKGFRHFV